MSKLSQQCLDAYNYHVKRGRKNDVTTNLLKQAGERLAELDGPITLDGDPKRQELFSAAIRGAIAAGESGTNAPPPGHWLQEWWDYGNAGTDAAPIGSEADYRKFALQVTRPAARDATPSDQARDAERKNGKTLVQKLRQFHAKVHVTDHITQLQSSYEMALVGADVAAKAAGWIERECNATDAKDLAEFKWAARCGVVQGERDIAIAALANIARNVHSGHARRSIAQDALNKLGGAYHYCLNCGGAHPRDPKIAGCQSDAAIAAERGEE